MDLSAIEAVIAVALLVVGPGGGIYIGLRASQGSLEKSGVRIEKVLDAVLVELRTLNHRVTKSEAHIEGLERREDHT